MDGFCVFCLLSRFFFWAFMRMRNNLSCSGINHYFFKSGFSGNTNIKRIDQASLLRFQFAIKNFLIAGLNIGKGNFFSIR